MFYIVIDKATHDKMLIRKSANVNHLERYGCQERIFQNTAGMKIKALQQKTDKGDEEERESWHT